LLGVFERCGVLLEPIGSVDLDGELAAVTTAAGETRPSLAWTRARWSSGAPGPEGMADIYVNTRE
jgi:hypothetical protein